MTIGERRLGASTNRFVRNVRVHGVVDGDHETGKIDMESSVVADKTTILHSSMGTKRVEGDAKAWNVEDVPYPNDVAVKAYFDGRGRS